MATLREIANELSLSVSTVSRVVNNKGYIKESTRERVMEAVSRRNYIPDNAARSLKTGQTRTIGVIIPDVTEVFFTNVLGAVEKELSNAGYNMLLCISGEDNGKEASYVNYFSHNHSDGIILATVSENSEPIQQALEGGTSIVFIDNLPNVGAAYDSVISDNIGASEAAASYLHGLGHRRIAAIAGKQTETTGIDRLLGFKRALAKLAAPADESLIRVGDFKEKSGYDAMRDLLEKAPGFTAVYAASAKMTYGAVKAITDLGMKIPDDVSVVGFDVHDPTGLVRPGITTVCQQEGSIGKIACQLLLDGINSPKSHVCRKVLLQPELVVRGSCRNI